MSIDNLDNLVTFFASFQGGQVSIRRPGHPVLHDCTQHLRELLSAVEELVTRNNQLVRENLQADLDNRQLMAELGESIAPSEVDSTEHLVRLKSQVFEIVKRHYAKRDKPLDSDTVRSDYALLAQALEPWFGNLNPTKG